MCRESETRGHSRLEQTWHLDGMHDHRSLRPAPRKDDKIWMQGDGCNHVHQGEINEKRSEDSTYSIAGSIFLVCRDGSTCTLGVVQGRTTSYDGLT